MNMPSRAGLLLALTSLVPFAASPAPPKAPAADHACGPQTAQHVGHGHLMTTHGLTLEGARVFLAGATNEARRLGVTGSFAVVDAGGHLLCLERLDGTVSATPPIATGKARTAALFGKPTRVFEKIINDGRTTMVTVPDFVPLQGGVPLIVDGHLVGAIGVSGASSAQQDDDLAEAAVAAFLATATTR